eukprot:279889-Chlamydomonas_euryale.AAC.1
MHRRGLVAWLSFEELKRVQQTLLVGVCASKCARAHARAAVACLHVCVNPLEASTPADTPTTASPPLCQT